MGPYLRGLGSPDYSWEIKSNISTAKELSKRSRKSRRRVDTDEAIQPNQTEDMNHGLLAEDENMPLGAVSRFRTRRGCTYIGADVGLDAGFWRHLLPVHYPAGGDSNCTIYILRISLHQENRRMRCTKLMLFLDGSPCMFGVQ